jgi:hypothetical protein
VELQLLLLEFQASALIMKHFKCFVLTIHSGDKKNDEPSKTEAMYMPQLCQQSTVEDMMKDMMIDLDRFFAYSIK